MWTAVGIIGAALIASEASGDAADTQASAALTATELERQQFEQARADIAPWREAGAGSLKTLQHYMGIGQPESLPKPERESFGTLEEYNAALSRWREQSALHQEQFGEFRDLSPGAYEKSPYYDFMLESGVGALESSASAGGRLRSGAQQKALLEYGQGLASADYGNWLGRKYKKLAPYQSLAGLGQTSAGQMGVMSSALGTSLANTALYQGGVAAQNRINQANIWNNAFAGLANLGSSYGMYGSGPMGGGML